MGNTVLQNHLKRQSIPSCEIRKELKIDYSTLRKWMIGVLFPHRLNAAQLIMLFSERGIELDYNDIYQIIYMDDVI